MAIRESAIEEAIAEALDERDPNAWTCIRLASFLAIKYLMFGDTKHQPTPEALAEMARGYSLAPKPQTPADDGTIRYRSSTEFGQAVEGKAGADVWPILDEVMSIIQTLSPKIYAAAMRRIKQ